MKKIYFIRHIPTKYNQLNYWCGQHANANIDPNWTFNKVVLELLTNTHFDKIYLSPLKRCIQTFKTINLKQDYIIDNRLIERDLGLLEESPCVGNQKNDIANWNLNTDLDMGVEKIQDMYFKRIKPFLDDLKKDKKSKNILIISHSWIGRLFKYHFTKDENEILTAPKNGEVICFELD